MAAVARDDGWPVVLPHPEMFPGEPGIASPGCSRAAVAEMNRLMITAEGGGSNGSRVTLFEVELQNLANETGLALQVCHYPPGTSSWNKKIHPQFLRVVANVADQASVGRRFRGQLVGCGDVGDGACGQAKAKQPPLAVCDDMDFGGSTAAGAANCLFAGSTFSAGGRALNLIEVLSMERKSLARPAPTPRKSLANAHARSGS